MHLPVVIIEDAFRFYSVEVPKMSTPSISVARFVLLLVFCVPVASGQQKTELQSREASVETDNEQTKRSGAAIELQQASPRLSID